MFQQEISQLNLQQLKAGEKRWVGSLLGSSAALLLKEIATQHSSLLVLVARNNQHVAQLESELEFYGIKPTIFPIGKSCLMIDYLRIRILSQSVLRFYRICRSKAYYSFQQVLWLNALHLIHGF